MQSRSAMAFEHSPRWGEDGGEGAPRGPAPGRSTLTSRLAPRDGTTPTPRESPVRGSTGRADGDAAWTALFEVLAPGPVQARGDARHAAGPDETRAIAAHGVADAGVSLPHLPSIEASFGRHAPALDGARAHVGADAATAAAAIGATAYATGRDVAFSSSPDLHLAAHEAAHVVQQRAGVSLAGGVGAAHDAYEQHADRVADAVVRGESAEAILGEYTSTERASSSAVQRQQPDNLRIEDDLRGSPLWAQDATGKPLPPSLDDIAQHDFRDCFLLGAVAALVHTHPETIRAMIRQTDDQTYTVDFGGADLPVSQPIVTVAYDLPPDWNSRHARVASRHALWPVILEEAYRAAKGRNDALDGGDPGTAGEDLTGMTATAFSPREMTSEVLLLQLAYAERKRLPVTLWNGENDVPYLSAPGLIGDHTYAVIGVDVKGQRIQLFNPWGYQDAGAGEPVPELDGTALVDAKGNRTRPNQPNVDGWVDVDVVRRYFAYGAVNG